MYLYDIKAIYDLFMKKKRNQNLFNIVCTFSFIFMVEKIWTIRYMGIVKMKYVIFFIISTIGNILFVFSLILL